MMLLYEDDWYDDVELLMWLKENMLYNEVII